MSKELKIAKDPTPCHIIINADTCTPETEASLLVNFLKNSGIAKVNQMTVEELVEATKKKLKVKTEQEIYESPAFRRKMGGTKAAKMLLKYFKIPGPWDTTALLDNFNIDNCLQQWESISQEHLGVKFKSIPFQMIDFQKYNTELASLDIMELVNDGYDSFGVVVNTDASTGRGKHWFCIYGDLKHEGSKSDPYTLEYFNSSGNPPMSEVIEWMEKTKVNLLKDYKKRIDIIYSAGKRLQYSHTECGVWSLAYIFNRLKGNTYNWFSQVGADDDDMINYRKHLFR